MDQNSPLSSTPPLPQHLDRFERALIQLLEPHLNQLEGSLSALESKLNASNEELVSLRSVYQVSEKMQQNVRSLTWRVKAIEQHLKLSPKSMAGLSLPETLETQKKDESEG